MLFFRRKKKKNGYTKAGNKIQLMLSDERLFSKLINKSILDRKTKEAEERFK